MAADIYDVKIPLEETVNGDFAVVSGEELVRHQVVWIALLGRLVLEADGDKGAGDCREHAQEDHHNRKELLERPH